MKFLPVLPVVLALSACSRGMDPELTETVATPWHLTTLYYYGMEEPEDIDSYCATFTVEGRISDSVNLYIAPFNQQINQLDLYGGIQTHYDGYTDKSRPLHTFRYRGRGGIFSRWEERNVDAIRQQPGGLMESSGHEGNFISVRNDFEWSEGAYRLCLRKSDVVEGEPLPSNYTVEDIAYGWGRFEHTWVAMEATDLSTDETVTIGELAFPGDTLSLGAIHVLFIEIYGHDGIFPLKDVPKFSLSISPFQVDGIEEQYGTILEVSNPFGEPIPVMTQATYLPDQRIVRIDVGQPAEKTGKRTTVLLSD